MKKFISLLAVMLSLLTVFAQVPEKIGYQAVIRDANNNMVANSNVGMQISILQNNANGIVVYSETHTISSNTNGLITLEIGNGNTSDAFSSIDWSVGPYFIKTETDPNGGTNYTITGTSQLLSVPLALYAKTSGSSTPGPQGEKGDTGADGHSAFQVAISSGFNGTEAEWLASLEGAIGKKGHMPGHEWDGTNLRFQNPDGTWGDFANLKGEKGEVGVDGQSAYQVAVNNDYSGTEQEWLASLKGDKGESGGIPSHQWVGTSLSFQNSDGTWSTPSDLKGQQGGVAAHHWNGTSIRFQNPDGSWGNYTNLKGTPGPAVNTIAVCSDNVSSYDSCSDYCSGTVIAGSKPVKYSSYSSGGTTYTNCNSCSVTADTGSCSKSSCKGDGYVICCVCQP